MPDTQTQYLTAGDIKRRFKMSDATLDRWLKNDALAFPRPLRINRRRLFDEAEVVEWERARAGKASA